MPRTHDYENPDYRGICRALSLGAKNGPYTETMPGGVIVLKLSDIATELLGSEWLKDKLEETARAASETAWSVGHAAGRDYQGDGWNCDVHDPEDDNPYRQARRSPHGGQADE